jgi:predicted nuclease of restriction endonuclease-like RecB superfamily
MKSQEHWSIEQYKEYQKSKCKKSKYGAIKTKIDGHTFDSKKEAEFYCNLKLRLQVKDIKGFCLQPIFILAEGLKYKADFIVFNNDGTAEVIDIKGFKTKEYITKKKVFEDKYDLKIIEL